MRSFAKPSGLERLSLEARIVYTAFAAFMLVGYASSAWLYVDDELGATGESARRYYLGDDVTTAKAGSAPRPDVSAKPDPSLKPVSTKPAAGDGPALELPSDEPTASGGDVHNDPRVEAAPTMRFAKAPRQVMETFHFHLFSVPVCLLIIAHIFMMSGLSTPVKAWTIGVGSLFTLVHVSMPPLVRLVSPAFAALMFPSAAIMGATWLVMTAWPIVEMWRLPRRPSREPRAPLGD